MLFQNPISITSTALTIVYLIGYTIYSRCFHPLRSVPGPFLASISRSWIVYKTILGNMEHTQRALHRRYGHLVRIAPNEVACSDPEAIKIIYGPKSKFTKSDYYDAWAPPSKGYVGHFPTRDEKLHAERRRIVNSVYSMSSVLENEKAIDSCTILLCKIMRELAQRTQPVELNVWTNRYAFDVFGEIYYGKRFGFMEEQADVGGYMDAIESLLPAFTIGGTLPSYLTKLYIASSIIFSSSVRGALGAVKRLEIASGNAVNQRKQELEQEKDEKRDILKKLLEIHLQRGEEVNFSDANVRVESVSSIFAGTDTTAIAINSVLYHLMRNPQAYAKLTNEIDAAASAGSISSPISYAEATRLPYLKACINEGMRLHPSVGLTMPRVVPAGGATISGFTFPAGYRVGINSAVVQYDCDVFGPDAAEFNPDRWLNGNSVQMEKAMLQFGAGARTCIGKSIALSEIYKLVPEIIRNFGLRAVEPDKRWTTRNYWFNKQSDIHILMEDRTKENRVS